MIAAEGGGASAQGAVGEVIARVFFPGTRAVARVVKFSQCFALRARQSVPNTRVPQSGAGATVMIASRLFQSPATLALVLACATTGVTARAQQQAPPANDSVFGATSITVVPGTLQQDISAATPDTEPVEVPVPTVWYEYIPTEDGTLTLDAGASSGPIGILFFFIGNGGALTVGGFGEGQLEVPVTAGVAHYFLFGAFDAPGDLVVFLDGPAAREPCRPAEVCSGADAPTNDALGCAALIPCLPFREDRDVAAASIGSDPDFGVPSVWYSYTPAADGVVRFDTRGSDAEAPIVIGIFAGPEVTQESSPVAFGFESAVASLTRGETYTIVLLFQSVPGRLLLRADATVLADPPPNDLYEDATPIEVPNTYVQDLSGATGSGSDPYYGGAIPSVWYTYTAPADGAIELDATQSSCDIDINAWRLQDGELVDAGWEVGRFIQNTSAGQTYVFMLNPLGPPGELVLSVEPTAPRPSNDGWWQWRYLTYPFHEEIDVTNASPAGDDPAPADGRATVWYALNPTFDGSVRFDTAGSNGHPELALFRVDFSIDHIYGIDDYRLLAQGTDHLDWYVEAGEEYRVMVMPNDATTLVMTVGPPPPANDDIAGAIEVDADALPFDDTFFTWMDGHSDDEPLPAQPTTVWYRLTPTRSMLVEGSVAGPYGAVAEQYWFDGAPSPQGLILPPSNPTSVPLRAGRTYYVGVTSAVTGTFSVRFAARETLANDEPSGATVITDLPYDVTLDRQRLTGSPADPEIAWATPPALPVSAWYLFTPPSDTPLALLADDKTAIGVFSGGPGAWSRLGQGGAGVIGSVDSVSLTGGVTYTIVVETDALATGSARIILAAGGFAGVQMSGTVRWNPLVMRSGEVILTDGDLVVPGVLEIAADGLSATYTARTSFSGAFQVVVSAQTCDAGAPCGMLATHDPGGAEPPYTVVDPGTRLLVTSPLVTLGQGDAVVLDLGVPAGEALVTACGSVDNDDRGEDVAIDTASSGGGIRLDAVSRPEADGSFCTAGVPGAILGGIVTSAPAACSSNLEIATQFFAVGVAPGVLSVTLPPMSFVVPRGTFDVTSGFAGHALFQQLVSDCLDGPCLPACNTRDQDVQFGVDEVTRTTLPVLAGDKHLSWMGFDVDYDFGALIDTLAAGQEPEDLDVFLSETISPLFDALGSFGVYNSQAFAAVPDGGTVAVDFSATGLTEWRPSGRAPEGEEGALFSIAGAVVAMTSQLGEPIEHAALGASFRFEGLRDFLLAVGEELPPELDAFDFDIAPGPISLSLASDRDWRLQEAAGFLVEFRDMSVPNGADLEVMDLRVRAAMLASSGLDMAFDFEPIAGSVAMAGADIPIGPLVAGEVIESPLTFLTPDVARLRIHLPPRPEGEGAGAVLVLTEDPIDLAQVMNFDLAGFTAIDNVNLVVKLSATEPLDEVGIPLPVGVSSGFLAHFGGGLDGELDIEENLVETALEVEVGAGDEVDQTPLAPFTHELEPQPMETCDATITFSGRVDDPDGVVEVRVNGAPVELDEEGSFAVQVDLAIGVNTVTLMARDAMDDVVSRTRTFLRGVTDSDGDGLTDCQELALARGGACPAIDDVDSDDDGVGDAEEAGVCADPCAADTDIDGLSDGQEVALGTSACVRDTDTDGLDDGHEQGLCGDPLVADTDGDGLLDGAERDLGTSPCLVDTDHDGVRDDAEADLCGDPLVADTDGDGLSDGQERDLGTLVCDGDTDGDALGDGDEAGLCGAPLVEDSDGDGLLDGEERDLGTSICDADSDDDTVIDGEEAALCGNPRMADTDGDGLSDGQERALGTSPCVADTDADGVSDSGEAALCGDPLLGDTDGDGLLDGQERDRDTSACDADTDGDGWGDALDPDPRSSDVRASLVRLLGELREAILNAPVAAFLGNNDVPREQRRNTMATLAAAGAQCAVVADLACVRSKVRTLADRTDGEDDDDWVVDEEAASDIFDRCDYLLELLALLP